jgi:hypothetical protein
VSRTRTFLAAGVVLFLSGLAGRGALRGQDVNDDGTAKKPLLPPELATRCEAAIKSKDYLKDEKITVRVEGTRMACEGHVPSKAHAAAVLLTCLAVEGVNQVDISRLTIGEAHAGVPAGKKLALFAVVMNPEERSPRTTPPGAHSFQSDVIVIGEWPVNAGTPLPAK